jgi:hypothetical protein
VHYLPFHHHNQGPEPYERPRQGLATAGGTAVEHEGAEEQDEGARSRQKTCCEDEHVPEGVIEEPSHT